MCYTQVWSLALMNDDQYLITGCNDRELHVWKITFLDNKNIEFENALGALNLNNDEENEESVDSDIVCYLYFYLLFLF